MFHHVFLFDGRTSDISIVLQFFFRLIANYVCGGLYDSLQVLSQDPLFAFLAAQSFQWVLLVDGRCATEDQLRCVLGVDHLSGLNIQRDRRLPSARLSIVCLRSAMVGRATSFTSFPVFISHRGSSIASIIMHYGCSEFLSLGNHMLRWD